MPITYRVHPALGIARVGDSPDDFFIGPEAPGVPPALRKPDDSSAQPGQYKDQQQRIKRQGARFRIYAYTEDDAGVVTKVQEITSAEAQIEWEVHLANHKAAAPRFKGTGRRNEGKPESDLIIDPGPQRISGANQAMKKLSGKFMKTMDVQLGDLLTDAAGRLIVLGGHGKSQSLPQSPLRHFADNDGWCDDMADGPVRATVRLHGGAAPIAVDPAWVIVAPPDFAPLIENVVTLYDVVYNMMARLDPRLAVSEATPVSFTKDIYPILRRVSHMHWVSEIAAEHHGEGKSSHFISRVPQLSSNAPQQAGARRFIFRKLRTPQGGGGSMPWLPGQAVSEGPGAALTEVQFKRMERWEQGTFDADWPGAEPMPTPLENLPEQDRPQALDRAALEACVGGPFFPGIEASRVMLDETTYDTQRLFRINAKLHAGTLTANMAVPWQADFHACSIDPIDPVEESEVNADWWPGQRPNQVRRGQERHAEWVPSNWRAQDMVENWPQLGFVVAKVVSNTVEFVEDERSV
jgi:hypothetical protein